MTKLNADRRARDLVLARVGVSTLCFAAIVFAYHSLRITFLHQYPNWDAFWGDTMFMASVQNAKAAFSVGSWPSLNLYAGFGERVALSAHTPFSVFNPLNLLMAVLSAEQFVWVRFVLHLAIGFVGTGLLVRHATGNESRALSAASLYITLPASLGLLGGIAGLGQFYATLMLLPALLYVQQRLLERPTLAARLAFAAVALFAIGDGYALSAVLLFPAVALQDYVQWSARGPRRLRLRNVEASVLFLISCVHYYAPVVIARLFEDPGLPYAISMRAYLTVIYGVLPSFVLPNEGSGVVLYLPAGLYLLALRSAWISRGAPGVEPGAIARRGLVLAVASYAAIFFFSFAAAGLVGGVMRQQLNAVPFMTVLFLFTMPDLTLEIGGWRGWWRKVLGPGLAIDLLLFVVPWPFHPPGWEVRHAPRAIAEGLSVLSPGVDWWPVLVVLNLVAVFATIAILRMRSSWFAAAAFAAVSSFTLVVHYQLRQTQQGDWQQSMSSDYRWSGFQNRLRCSASQWTAAMPARRVLLVSGTSWKGEGRNAKLVAESELGNVMGANTLPQYREWTSRWERDVLASVSGSTRTSHFWPPLADDVAQRADAMRAIGASLAIVADGTLPEPGFRLVAECETPVNAWYPQETDGGPTRVYELRTPGSIATFEPLPAGIQLGAENVPVRLIPNGLTAVWTAASDGYLVVRYKARRGWRATIDGRPQRIDRSDEGWLRIPLTQGLRAVEVRFVDEWYLAGVIATLTFLLAWCLLMRNLSRSLRHRVD